MSHVEENRRLLHSELDALQLKIEGLTGQLEQLAVAAEDLQMREHRLQIDLDTSSHPRTLYNEKRPADVAIELGRVRSGINELGRCTRDVARALQQASDRQRDLQRELAQLD